MASVELNGEAGEAGGDLEQGGASSAGVGAGQDGGGDCGAVGASSVGQVGGGRQVHAGEAQHGEAGQGQGEGGADGRQVHAGAVVLGGGLGGALSHSAHKAGAILPAGAIPGKNGGWLKPADSARALELAEIRRERARARAEAAVDAAGGWESIVKARAVHAMTDKAGAAASASFVGRAADLMPGRLERDSGPSGGGVSISIGESAAAGLLDLLARLGGV